MCFNAPLFGLVVAVVGVLVSVGMLLLYPPPPLSPRIENWRSQGQFYNFHGHNIFYMGISGTGRDGTVICLHGFPTFSWDWSKILPGLQSQFSRVILLDFLGFGLSDKPSSHNYSIFEQADIVAQLAGHLSAGEVHLLSHDYGDTVALELLSRHNNQGTATDDDDKEKPGREGPVLVLRSLTMLNGGVFPETNKPRLIQQLLLIPVLGPFLSRLTFFHIFKISFREVFGENKPTEDDYLDFYAANVHQYGHHVTSSLLQYIPERQHNKDRWVRALRNSRVPVVMIYGPADPVNPPQFAEMFRKEAGQHQLVVLGKEVGHYPQWEDPHATLQHLQHFIVHLTSSPSSSSSQPSED